MAASHRSKRRNARPSYEYVAADYVPAEQLAALRAAAGAKHFPKAGSSSDRKIDRAETCYQVLALLAGARGIITELEDHAVPEGDGLLNIDRLLGEAAQRLRQVADAEASNG
jgi:hypothetical protein